VTKKEPLHLDLADRKEDAKHRMVLKVEDIDASLLRHVRDGVATLPIQDGGSLLRHGVCDIVERPVKHLDQEWILLQDAAVKVIGKACRIRGLDGYGANMMLRLSERRWRY